MLNILIQFYCKIRQITNNLLITMVHRIQQSTSYRCPPLCFENSLLSILQHPNFHRTCMTQNSSASDQLKINFMTFKQKHAFALPRYLTWYTQYPNFAFSSQKNKAKRNDAKTKRSLERSLGCCKC